MAPTPIAGGGEQFGGCPLSCSEVLNSSPSTSGPQAAIISPFRGASQDSFIAEQCQQHEVVVVSVSETAFLSAAAATSLNSDQAEKSTEAEDHNRERKQQEVNNDEMEVEVSKLNAEQKDSVVTRPEHRRFRNDPRVVRNMLAAERRIAILDDYFANGKQTEIRPFMRTLTCEWLYDVSSFSPGFVI